MGHRAHSDAWVRTGSTSHVALLPPEGADAAQTWFLPREGATWASSPAQGAGQGAGQGITPS